MLAYLKGGLLSALCLLQHQIHNRHDRMSKFLKLIYMKLKFSVIQKLKEEIIDSHNHVSQRLRPLERSV